MRTPDGLFLAGGKPDSTVWFKVDFPIRKGIIPPVCPHSDGGRAMEVAALIGFAAVLAILVQVLAGMLFRTPARG